MTLAQLTEIQRRLEASTPGPWSAHHHIGCSTVHAGERITDTSEIALLRRGVTYTERDNSLGQGEFMVPDQVRADADFVAHAKSDMQTLLDEMKRLLTPCIDSIIRTSRES